MDRALTCNRANPARDGENLMAARKSSRVNPAYKKRYRMRNWPEYEAGLPAARRYPKRRRTVQGPESGHSVSRNHAKSPLVNTKFDDPLSPSGVE